MSTAPNATRRVVVRGTLLVFAVLALAAILYVIANTSPTRDSLFPKCFFYQTTGLHCPGCGTGRALHFALNGEILRAAEFNILSVVILPIMVFFGLLRLYEWVLDRPRRIRLGGRWIWLLFVVMLIFWIIRNIPAHPFTLLAPVELP